MLTVNKSVETPLTGGALASAQRRIVSTGSRTDVDVQRRLFKNLCFALNQQGRESDHGFRLQELPEDRLAGWFKKPIAMAEQEVNGRRVGVASCQGVRPTMEDMDLATQVTFYAKGQPCTLDVFAVFDGHGGERASQYIKEKIPAVLSETLERHNSHGVTDAGVWQALKECFVKLHEEYQEGSDGTTATVALILGDYLWVANVGDSRTIISDGGRALQLTEDAKPQEDRFGQGVEKLGGYVLFGRVMGSLGVARAIGDKNVIGRNGCCISPKPKITRLRVDKVKPGSLLILACDGLYDVASTNEVVAAVNAMAGQQTSLSAMAGRLVNSAILNGSRDNVSVMVVRL